MNESLHISPAGIALQKKYAGGPVHCTPNVFASEVRISESGKPLIGWNHLVTSTGDYMRTSTIDAVTADKLLAQDNLWHEQIIKSIVKVPLAQCEFDALVSLLHDIAAGNAARVDISFEESLLIAHLNAGDKRAAAAQFLKWNKYRYPGTDSLRMTFALTSHRTDDRSLFLGMEDV